MLTHQGRAANKKKQLFFGFLLTIQSVYTFASPIGYEGARHLLARTRFGFSSMAEIQRFAGMEKTTAVDTILSEANAPLPAPPDEAILRYVRRSELQSMNEQDKRALAKVIRGNAQALKGWWLSELLTTQAPFRENMVLFWHGHFTSEIQKVKQPAWMYAQNQLFRKEALGNFGRLLHAVAKDPAMLVYLDGAKSRKEKPNENFARELLELYTLGEGHYEESDIRELAKTFTGWSVDPETGAFIVRDRQLNASDKRIFGESGNWDGDAAIDLILSRPETSRWITTQLWKYFISPTPDPQEIHRIASSFAKNYEIRPLMRELLLSNAFWDTKNRGQLVKSPTDLLVGTLRQFADTSTNIRGIQKLSASLGQDLMSPPNVKGWPGGTLWINTNTLLLRQQWLARLASGKADNTHGKTDVKKWLAGFQTAQIPLRTLLLPDSSNMQLENTGSDSLESYLANPAYQLK